ncbi:hypothetical protein K3217_20055 [bacterium BD-1]|uniref:hypothetical protein n=1 Tax=Arenimonas sp. TaxID=1872635 RepID=UPI001E58C8DA|nr:hypothetical protein [Ottowia caeni]
MRTSFRVALLVLCASLLAAATWRWVQAEGDPAAAASAEGDEPSAATPAEPHDLARPLPPRPATPSAGDTEAPLPPDIAALVARADAGDARAACTLGTRLLPCAYADFWSDDMLAAIREQEASAEASGNIARANDAAGQLLRGTSIRRHCDPYPAHLKERANDYLRQAALAGEPEAIVRYSSGQALARRATQQHAFLRSPSFDAWRSDALALVESLQRSGQPEAVLVRLFAINDGSHLGLIMPPDPVQDEAYRQLARLLFGEQEALRQHGAPPGLTTEQQQAAAQMAKAWHREQFSGRRFRLEDHLSALSTPLANDVPEGWPRPSEDATSCFRGDEGAGP